MSFNNISQWLFFIWIQNYHLIAIWPRYRTIYSLAECIYTEFIFIRCGRWAKMFTLHGVPFRLRLSRKPEFGKGNFEHTAQNDQQMTGQFHKHLKQTRSCRWNGDISSRKELQKGREKQAPSLSNMAESYSRLFRTTLRVVFGERKGETQIILADS